MTMHFRKSATVAPTPQQDAKAKVEKQYAGPKKSKSSRRSFAQHVMSGSFMLLCLLALALFMPAQKSNPLHTRKLDKVEKFEVPTYGGILRQEHSWTTSSHSEIPNYEKTLVVMTHREDLFGCFSLEKYLSPKFHTLYVFDEETIKGLNIDTLVRGATKETSAGAHVFYSDGLGGLEYARNVGQKFAGFLEENGYPLEYLLVMDCNIHPLPKQHKMHVPMDEIVSRMARDFTKSKESRAKGQFLEGNYDQNGNTRLNTHDIKLKMQKSKMDILAMNTVMWEEVPNLEEVSHFSGSDFSEWLKYNGKKPQHLVEESLPWLWDSSVFFEGHVVMYDLKMLRKLSELSPFFISKSQNTYEDYHSFPVVANIFNMTVIRNNDIYLHYSFYPKDKFDSNIDMDWLKGKSFDMIGRLLFPRRDFNQQILPYKAHRFVTWNMIHPRKMYLCLKWDTRQLLPRNGNISGVLISDFNIRRVFEGILMFFGYQKKSENLQNEKSFSYELDAGFPGSRVLRLKPGVEESDQEWTRILTIESNEQLWTLYMCRYDNPMCDLSARLKMPLVEKQLDIPSENATIVEFYFAEGCVEDRGRCWEKGYVQAMQVGGVTSKMKQEFLNSLLTDL